MSFIRPFAAIALVPILSGCLSGMDGGPLDRPGEPTGEIVLQNRSGTTIDVVTVSDCDNFTHGFNRLDGATIPNGSSYAWTVSAGCWDVEGGVIATGQFVQFHGEQVQAGRTTTLTVQ